MELNDANRFRMSPRPGVLALQTRPLAELEQQDPLKAQSSTFDSSAGMNLCEGPLMCVGISGETLANRTWRFIKAWRKNRLNVWKCAQVSG